MSLPAPEGATGHILVVCTGNVCRSPYLEHVLRQGLDRRWGPGHVAVRSAGVQGLVGEPMAPLAAAQLAARGLPAAGFRARRLGAGDVTGADLVLAVTREHRAAVLRMAPTALRRTVTPAEVALAAGAPDWVHPATTNPAELLREVGRLVVAARPALRSVPPADLDLDDPYGRAEEAYVAMAETVHRLLPGLLRALSPGGSGPAG